MNPYALLQPHLNELIVSPTPPRHPEPRLTPVLGRGFFRSWLRHHGIDPKTGRMTVDGLAFFEDAVAFRPSDLADPDDLTDHGPAATGEAQP